MLDGGGGHAGGPRPPPAIGIGPIAQHQYRSALDAPFGTGIEQRLQVGSAAGNQKGNAAAHAGSPVNCRRGAVGSSRGLIQPSRYTVSPAASSRRWASSARSAGRQTTMPTPQLKVD